MRSKSWFTVYIRGGVEVNFPFDCTQTLPINQLNTYKEQIKTLSAKLKQAEARAEFAEKSVQKLQKEVGFFFENSLFNGLNVQGGQAGG